MSIRRWLGCALIGVGCFVIFGLGVGVLYVGPTSQGDQLAAIFLSAAAAFEVGRRFLGE